MKKIAIVTGASGGIGGSIAKRLAKDGFSVVVNYAGKLAPAQAVVADIKAAGGQGIAVQADVAIAADVERLFKESMDAFGRPDVMPFGTRPFRVHIDPAQDGAEIVNGVADRVRAELLRNMRLADLLRPWSTEVPAQKAS